MNGIKELIKEHNAALHKYIDDIIEVGNVFMYRPLTGLNIDYYNTVIVTRFDDDYIWAIIPDRKSPERFEYSDFAMYIQYYKFVGNVDFNIVSKE